MKKPAAFPPLSLPSRFCCWALAGLDRYAAMRRSAVMGELLSLERGSHKAKAAR
jgi:hypothetical protein